MKVISATLLASLTVLGIHTGAAHAQQPAPPPDQGQYPPGYAPPPGYTPPPPPQQYQQSQPGYPQQAYPQQGYPQPYPQQGYPPPPPTYAPPRGYGAPPPPRYSYYPPPPPPPAPRSTIDRPFSIGASLGFGVLRGSDDFGDFSYGATAYAFRIGFGLGPRTQFLLGLDGALASDQGIVYDQTIYYLGLQQFLTQHLFLRGGIGVANITAEDSISVFAGKAGMGLTGTIGLELIQGYNWSLELAGVFSGGFYDGERWGSSTVNLGLNFF